MFYHFQLLHSIFKGYFENINTFRIIFETKIDRIRDLEIHPNNGKIYLLSEKYYSEKGPEEDGLWLMEKK